MRCHSLRQDTTKVDHALPQRDNWALPYFSCQVAALTGFLSNNISSATEVCLLKASTINYYNSPPPLTFKTVFFPCRCFAISP